MSTPTLLLAYDGSPAAATAIRFSGALFAGSRAVVAFARPAPLSLEHAAVARLAIPDDAIAGGIAALNRAADEAARATAAEGCHAAIDAGLSAETAIVDGAGSPWRSLQRLADEVGAAVICCGSRGQGPFSRATLGSTSSGLVHHARRPVLVVPAGGGEASGPLVIGYDGSDDSARAVARAAALFPGHEAIVVHVWESMIQHTRGGRALGSAPLGELREMAGDLDASFLELAARTAEEGAALARDRGLRAGSRAFEAEGSAWHGLLAAARACGAAAIVVGSLGRGAVASTLLGSVSSGLVHNADLPVLVVPVAGAADA